MENLTIETQNIEFKESWQDNYLKTICAFANASGGRLDIGKNDKGEIVGLSDIKKLMEYIPNKIKNSMAIVTDITLQIVDEKQYISIKVNAYPFPISYRGVYYIRSGSTTLELTGNALDEFILRSKGKTWDGVPVPKITYDDFEKDAFKAFRRKAKASGRLTAEDLEINDEELLENLHLTEGNYLKRAALLVFHQNPEKWVPGAYLKLGYFANAADLIFQDEIHGPLITMADKAEELVYSKYFKGIISYDGLQRIETFPIPRQAFREAILNAIIHRDYSTGNPIHIHIYPDEVLIYNDGKLPDSWTIDDLFLKHTSKPYNPFIAGAFFRSGQIESWGRGIEKITNACNDWGMPKPFYRVKGNDVMIGFHIEDIYRENAGLEGIEREKYEIKHEKKYEIKYGIKYEINQSQNKILNLLNEYPNITMNEIANEIGISTHGIDKNIRYLKRIGLIERAGSRKKGFWVIKNNNYPPPRP